MSTRPARPLLAALAIFTASLFLAGGVASAATQVLTITPSTTRPTVQPGSSSNGSFQVINQGEASFHLNLYASPYSVKTEAYTPDFSPLPGKPKVADWLKLTPSQATITPNETLTVHYTLSVPAGTQSGGYYAVAFAETQTPKNGAGVIVNERVGEIFYIDVAGPVKKSGKVLGWTSPFLQQSPVTATLRLENSGGIDYPSDINISANDLFGNSKYTLATQKAVLPQTIRSVPFEWKSAPALGLFKIRGTASVFGQTEHLPTKYVLVASTPVRIAFLCLILVVLAWIAGRYIARRKRLSRKSYRSPKG